MLSPLEPLRVRPSSNGLDLYTQAIQKKVKKPLAKDYVFPLKRPEAWFFESIMKPVEMAWEDAGHDPSKEQKAEVIVSPSLLLARALFVSLTHITHTHTRARAVSQSCCDGDGGGQVKKLLDEQTAKMKPLESLLPLVKKVWDAKQQAQVSAAASSLSLSFPSCCLSCARTTNVIGGATNRP